MAARYSHTYGSSIPVSTNLSSGLLDRLEARAKEDGVSRSEVIRNAVEAYLGADGGEA